MLKWFLCPDNERIEVTGCLKEGGCRLPARCATRSYLKLVSNERPWKGKVSTTQCISGTLYNFLKLTKEYAISPDSRAFMIHGTKGHLALEGADDEYSLLEESFADSEITGIADVLECENGRHVLVDYKTSGSFKIAKALGFYVDEEETGEKYKTGKKAGQPKTRKVLKRDDAKIDRREWELQLSKYAIEFEKRGFKVNELRIQAICRDGNTHMARSRGVFRNVYYFAINRLPDAEVIEYFETKKNNLLQALKQGYWDEICSAHENWDSLKCQNYCEVAEYCKYGKYLKKEKENEDMAIKGLSDVRRLPRLGKLRLGIKKKTASGKEYPAEVDYFIIDPQTPSELENQKLKDEFHRLYGEQPKSIKFMFPVGDSEVYFPQFYKRYGGSLLQCKGDGETATCSSEEHAKGLKVIGKDEMGMVKVKCEGTECPLYKTKKCTESAVLQVLLPDLPGAGVWQIVTGSFHSIVSLNSCIDYIRSVCGRAHMIPLTLERRAQETQHEGKKATHYILHVNMDIKLSDIQKFAMIEPTKVLLELPPVEVEKEDILFRENRAIEASEAIDLEIVEPEASAPPKTDVMGVPGKAMYLDRITKISNRFESQNWISKHYKEITALPEDMREEVIAAYKQRNEEILADDYGNKGTHEAEEGVERNFEAEMEACSSLDELKAIWTACVKAVKKGSNEYVLLETVKNIIKTKLSKE